MTRPTLPLAAAGSVLALLAGIYASRPVSSEPSAERAATRESPAPTTPPRASGGSADACAFPLRWRVARVDTQFGLSPDEAVAAVERAAALWEEATGRSLFERDDAGGFPIAFVYDGRQAAAQERARQEAELDERTRAIESERARLEARTVRHRGIQADFESRRTVFNEWADRHNETVRQWNRDRSVPPEILRELRANDERLRQEEARLAEEGREIEAAGQALTADLDRFRRAVEEHNARGAALDRVFASGSVLAGRYLEARRRDGRVIPGAREIQIFQFDDAAHLRLVIAHELGHAMGLGHASRAEAVMSEEHERVGTTIGSGIHATDLELLGERCPER